MDVNSLPKTVTRQRRDRDLNPGPSALDSNALTTRLPSHPIYCTVFPRYYWLFSPTVLGTRQRSCCGGVRRAEATEYTSEFRITSLNFTEALANQSSAEYRELYSVVYNLVSLITRPHRCM